MKTFTKIFAMFFAMTLAVIVTNAQSQIQFEGLYTEGEGAAGWNADGSGPEPAVTGHGGIYYYTSSLDYVNPGSSSGGHMLDNINGFPLFAQALDNNGFTPDQVTFTFGLADMGNDIEGTDWFQIGALNYSNFYPIIIRMYLAGDPLISATGNYGIYIVGAGTQEMETGYLKIDDASAQSSGPVKLVAAAFVSDMDGEELKADIQVIYAANLSGNGRSGGYFDAMCTFTKGLPTLPMQGLHADNEGNAGWNADGTGPEPYGNGHGDVVYYSASVDYDGINPDPNACLGHFLEGSTGFFNTLLQLQYRGFEIGDLKLKMGLCSLGPDVEGEDWGYENGYDWLNEYNNSFTIELNGEPILEVLQDTNKMTFINPGTVTWSTKSSVGKVYDIAENASLVSQYVAQSFLKDLGSHYLVTDVADISYVGPMPPGNGRSGVWYELVEGAMVGMHEQATFIPEGPVSGTWTAENSPYYIEGPVIVEEEETLTIESGVRVAVRGAYPIKVIGAIQAIGTPNEKIMFTASNPNIWSDGIDYNGNLSSIITPSVYDHCIFQYGYAQGTAAQFNSGGAMAIYEHDSISVLNSIFRHNKADIDAAYPPSGGAIAIDNTDLFLQKCTFYDNSAEYGGAILAYSGSNPVISNCLFYENESEYGGALAFYDYSNGVLINNTLSDNYASYGGGLYFYMQSNPEIINTIIWNNEATIGDQVYSSYSATSNPGFYYCDIEGGQAGFGGSQINGGYFSNLEEDPLFETPPDYPPYMISGESPCIDFGTPDTSAWYYPQYLPENCLCGNPRTYGNCIDIGAYEYFITGINEKPAEAHAMHLFPNPAQHETTIRFSMQNAELVTVELYNSLGEKVETIFDGNLLAGDHALSYQTTRLKPGVYFCIIKSGDQVISQKLLKQ
jgi:hypothetical protein